MLEDRTLTVRSSTDLTNIVVIGEVPDSGLSGVPAWQATAPGGDSYPVQLTSLNDGRVLVGVYVPELASGTETSLALTPAEQAQGGRGIDLRDEPENGRVVIDYSMFLQGIYHYGREAFKPRFYPLTAPVARLGDIDDPDTVYPKSITDDSPPDHIWHRSLWYACGDVNGVDFYLENGGEGRTVHQSFSDVFSGPVFGGFRESLQWITPDGRALVDDQRSFTLYRIKGTERVFDIEATFRAHDEPVTFGSTNENALPLIRVADVIDEWDGGTITLSDGTSGGKEAFGKRAEWADCTGPLARRNGEPWHWGIAMLDHPSNRNHPNAWFARSYGPLGTNLPFFDGALTLQPGESWTIRNRIVIHEGDPWQAGVPERFKQYAANTTITID
jgi:hypothetical protein